MYNFIWYALLSGIENQVYLALAVCCCCIEPVDACLQSCSDRRIGLILLSDEGAAHHDLVNAEWTTAELECYLFPHIALINGIGKSTAKCPCAPPSPTRMQPNI
jgi:hypothetical protein